MEFPLHEKKTFNQKITGLTNWAGRFGTYLAPDITVFSHKIHRVELIVKRLNRLVEIGNIGLKMDDFIVRVCWKGDDDVEYYGLLSDG